MYDNVGRHIWLSFSSLLFFFAIISKFQRYINQSIGAFLLLHLHLLFTASFAYYLPVTVF